MKTSLHSVAAWLAWASLAGLTFGGVAVAQEPVPGPKSTAQIDAGEPRATTSPALPSSVPADAPPSVTAPGTPVVAPRQDAAGPKRAAAPAAKGTAAAKAPGAADRVDLGTATVTGDREQPKVMYVVPWKSADIGDLSGKPMNSLIDEALSPVDRDEFKREVVYFKVMKSDRSGGGAPAAPAAQGEK